jgi:hypothetical protein
VLLREVFELGISVSDNMRQHQTSSQSFSHVILCYEGPFISYGGRPYTLPEQEPMLPARDVVTQSDSAGNPNGQT